MVQTCNTHRKVFTLAQIPTFKVNDLSAACTSSVPSQLPSSLIKFNHVTKQYSADGVFVWGQRGMLAMQSEHRSCPVHHSYVLRTPVFNVSDTSPQLNQEGGGGMNCTPLFLFFGHCGDLYYMGYIWNLTTRVKLLGLKTVILCQLIWNYNIPLKIYYSVTYIKYI